jgi:hypothetical protein
MCTVILTCTNFTSIDPQNDNVVFEEKKIVMSNQPTMLKSKAPGGIRNQGNQGFNSGGDPAIPEGVKKVVKTKSLDKCVDKNARKAIMAIAELIGYKNIKKYFD